MSSSPTDTGIDENSEMTSPTLTMTTEIPQNNGTTTTPNTMTSRFTESDIPQASNISIIIAIVVGTVAGGFSVVFLICLLAGVMFCLSKKMKQSSQTVTSAATTAITTQTLMEQNQAYAVKKTLSISDTMNNQAYGHTCIDLEPNNAYRDLIYTHENLAYTSTTNFDHAKDVYDYVDVH